MFTKYWTILIFIPMLLSTSLSASDELNNHHNKFDNQTVLAEIPPNFLTELCDFCSLSSENFLIFLSDLGNFFTSCVAPNCGSSIVQMCNSFCSDED